jgi:hypothetical protein
MKAVAVVLVVALAAMALSYNTLDGEFVFDDRRAIESNKVVTGKLPYKSIWTSDFWGNSIKADYSHKSYRPLTSLSFRLQYSWSGLNPYAWHVVNVLAHGLVAAFVAITALRLFDNQLLPSLLAGLLFACHPVHVESVANVVGRAEVFSAACLLASFNAYMSGSAPSQRPEVACFFLLLTTAFGAAALLCKEQGVIVFPICVAYELTYGTPLIDVIRRSLREKKAASSDKEHSSGGSDSTGPMLRIGWILLSLGMLVKMRWDVMGSGMRSTGFTEWQNPAAAHSDWFVRLLSLNYYFGRHVLLLLWPLPPTELCHDWSGDVIPLLLSAADPRNLLALSVYACIATFACLALLPLSSVVISPRDRQLLVISGALLLLPFVLSANLLVTVGFVVAERTLYTPSIGVSILFGWGAARLCSASSSTLSQLRRALVAVALVALLGACSWRTWDRNGVWLNKRTLFESGLRVVPLNPRMHYDLGVLQLETANGRPKSETADREAAIASFGSAIAICPFHTDAMVNRGTVLMASSRASEAEVDFRSAISLYPLATEKGITTYMPNAETFPYLNLAQALVALGRLDDAKATLEEAQSRWPKNPNVQKEMRILMKKLAN